MARDPVFGKFPGTVPSMFVITGLQAHHLDLEFYDTFYKPRAYLGTHARHRERWHCLSPCLHGEARKKS